MYQMTQEFRNHLEINITKRAMRSLISFHCCAQQTTTGTEHSIYIHFFLSTFIRFRAFLVFQGGECLRNSRGKVSATIERLNYIILRAVNEGKATKKCFCHSPRVQARCNFTHLRQICNFFCSVFKKQWKEKIFFLLVYSIVSSC